MSGFVYAIASDNAVKIGWSSNPTERLRGLRTASPGRLSLVGQIEATKARESELHRQFSPWRIVGEWFRMEADVAMFVNSLPPPPPASSRPEQTNGILSPGQSRAARVLLGWTASMLAAKSGVSKSTINRLESEAGLVGRRLLDIAMAIEAAGVELIPGGVRKP